MTSKTDLILAARRYTNAERSDPFAYNRAIKYLVASDYKPTFNQKGQPAWYDAEEADEERELPDGTKYRAVVYRNIVRP